MLESLKSSKLSILPNSQSSGDMSNTNYAGLVVIGSGVQMKCETLRCSQLEVLGDVDMNVEAEIFVVREGGTFKGSVKTNQAEIEGSAEGVFSVKERLTIHGGGKVHGDVDYGELAIEAGGQLMGNLAIKASGEIKASGQSSKKARGLSSMNSQTGEKSSKNPKSKLSASDKKNPPSEIKTWLTEDA